MSKMTLIEELRSLPAGCSDTSLTKRAADEIEWLKEVRVEDALAQLEHANTCSAEIERLRKALGTAIVAMEIASAIPAVKTEYDFSYAIKTAWEAYNPGTHNG